MPCPLGWRMGGTLVMLLNFGILLPCSLRLGPYPVHVKGSSLFSGFLDGGGYHLTCRIVAADAMGFVDWAFSYDVGA